MTRPYGISNKDIILYIGLEELAKSVQINYDSNIAYHSLCHLYSSLGMDSDKFFNENILALSLDGEPDITYDKKARKKYYFAGAYCEKGKINTFPISSPGVMWALVADEIGIPEGTLMALATASNSESLVEFKMPDEILNLNDSLKDQKYFKEVI